MEDLKFNFLNASALLAGMALAQVETILSILVLSTALAYNIVKLVKQRRDK